MRPLRLVASLITAALFAGACISETTVTPLSNESLAGTYTLRTVNGSGLPAVVQSENGTTPKVEVLSDVLTLRVDGTWDGVQSLRITSGTTADTQTLSSGGTYTASETLVSFHDTVNGDFAVSVSGTSFLLSNGTLTFLYSK